MGRKEEDFGEVWRCDSEAVGVVWKGGEIETGGVIRCLFFRVAAALLENGEVARGTVESIMRLNEVEGCDVGHR